MTTSAAIVPGTPRGPRRRSRLRGGQTLSGWLFTAPVLVILGVFLLVPVVMAAWVSVSDWAARMHPDDRAWVVDFCIAQSKSGTDHEADYRALTAHLPTTERLVEMEMTL